MPGVPNRREIVCGRVDDLDRAARGAASGRPRAIHRARVASRRLSELLPLLQVEVDRRRRFGRDLRRLRRALGPLRETDVLIGLVDDLAGQSPGSARGLAAVRAALAADRREALERAQRNGVERRLRRTVKRLRSLVEGVGGHEGAAGRRWRWVLDALVARRAQALIDAVVSAGADEVAERVHEVRIRLKKLRYAVELAEVARGVVATPELRRLTRQQALLGRLHDRQVLAERIRQVQAPSAGVDRQASDELNPVLSGLDGECRTLHARYLRSRASIQVACRGLLARAGGVATRGHAGVTKRAAAGR